MVKPCILIFITLLFIRPAAIGETYSPSNKNTFIIGVEDINYFPMYGLKNGEYAGYARELLDAFASDKGYSFTYKSLPILRLYNDFLNNRTVDFKYPDNTFWKQDLKAGKDVTYSDSVVDYIDGVMVLPSHKGQGIKRFKRLGSVIGFTPWEYLDDIKAGNIKHDTAPHYQCIIKMALAGRVDGAYTCVSVMNFQLEQLNKKGALVFDPFLPHTKSSYLLSSVKYPQVIQQFSNWLVLRQAFVEGLREKYKVGVE